MAIAQKSPLNDIFNAHTSHYHITLSNVTTEELIAASKLIAGKPTPIDLIMHTKDFHDRMITKHQSGISLIPVLLDVATLTAAGYNVARHKLEMNISLDEIDQLLHLPISAQHYIELHAKVSNIVPRINMPRFAFSSNPNATGYYFYNTRIRNKEHISETLTTLEDIKRHSNAHGYDIDHIHYEYTLFDSHVHHDSAWA